MIPSSIPRLSDLYTLSQSKLLENHTLHSGTYLYSPYMAVPPPPPGVSLSSYSDYFTLIEDNMSEKEERDQYPAILMLTEPAI